MWYVMKSSDVCNMNFCDKPTRKRYVLTMTIIWNRLSSDEVPKGVLEDQVMAKITSLLTGTIIPKAKYIITISRWMDYLNKKSYLP